MSRTHWNGHDVRTKIVGDFMLVVQEENDSIYFFYLGEMINQIHFYLYNRLIFIFGDQIK